MTGINIGGIAQVDMYAPVIGAFSGFPGTVCVFACPIGGPNYIDLTSTHRTSNGGNYWAKPCRVKNTPFFVCDYVSNAGGGAGGSNQIYLIDIEADTSTQIASESNGLGGGPGVNAPMYPDVSPNGLYVIYRRQYVGSPFTRSVRRVDIDGANDVELWNQASHLGPKGSGTISTPLYSYDGTKIAFKVTYNFPNDDDIYVMDADGSNSLVVATTPFGFQAGRYGYSWANTQNVLAYSDNGDGTTHIVNADGTGDTVIYTDSDFVFGVEGPTKWWSPDDTAIVYMQYDSGDPDPKGTLGTIDVAGGGFTAFSPSFKIFGGLPRFQPQVFRGRVWCQPYDASPSPSRDYILSCGFDGSDPFEEAFWLWADPELYQGFFYDGGTL